MTQRQTDDSRLKSPRHGFLHYLAHVLGWNGVRSDVQYPPDRDPDDPRARWHLYTVCATCGERRFHGLGRYINLETDDAE